MKRFSIVIPTFNEEKYLGNLLKLIKEQTLQPKEIIVADNNSGDRTVLIAKKYGCKIVKGGNPAVGRTNGGKVAKNEILLFLDADNDFRGRDFLAKLLKNFHKNEITTVWFRSRENNIFNQVLCLVANIVKFMNIYTAKFFHTLIGDYGILVLCSKKLFDEVGGFRGLNGGHLEDSLFFRDAVKKGYKYSLFPAKVLVSDRRLRNKGVKQLVIWAFWVTALLFATLFKIKLSQRFFDLYEVTRKGRA